MNEIEQLNTIEAEALRMLDRLTDLRKAINNGRTETYYSRDRAAFKRATLDLSAMLADYRQGGMR
jgi:hypothetical protein